MICEGFMIETVKNNEGVRELLVNIYNKGLKKRKNYENKKERGENEKAEEIIKLIPEKIHEAGHNEEEYVLIMKLEQFQDFYTQESIFKGLAFIGKGPIIYDKKLLNKIPKDQSVDEYELRGSAKKIFDYLQKNNLKPSIISKDYQMSMFSILVDYYLVLNMQNIKESLESKVNQNL